MSAHQTFMVKNARRLSMAGKTLYPIRYLRISKRLYRQTAPTLVIWGREDRFIPPPYAERFAELLPEAKLAFVEEAGHMLPYEKPERVAEAIVGFCS